MNGESVRAGRLVSFGEHNATRRCNAAECDADAVGYLTTESTSTAFVCRDHADLADNDPGALAVALGGEA